MIKVRQLQWYEANGMNVTTEQIIEDSNIQGLAVSSNTSSTPAKTVTTTVFVNPSQTMVTSTITTTRVTTLSTTATSTITIAEPSIYALAVGAIVITAIFAVTIMRKRK